MQEDQDPEKESRPSSSRNDFEFLNQEFLAGLNDENSGASSANPSTSSGSSAWMPELNEEGGLEQLLHLEHGDNKVSLKLNKALLDYLCKEIGNKPVSLISTVGKFRKGKTFWLNFLLKALKDGVNRPNFQPGEIIGGSQGIKFKCGNSRHTEGIMIWPEVFHRKDRHGNDIAVLLVDTQGTFDSRSNLRDSAVIFIISLLMSSVKIFNVQGNVDGQDLDALGTFIKYSCGSSEKAQKFLIMVRDVNSTTTGLSPEYLEELRAETSHMSELFEGIMEAFEEVDAFLVPPPTNEVRVADGAIRVDVCGEAFVSVLYDCTEYILENLEPKLLAGTAMTGETLLPHVMHLTQHIRENQHRFIVSAHKATSELFYEKAISIGREKFFLLYEQLIRSYDHRPIEPEEYERRLREIVSATLQAYLENSFFGGPEENQRRFEAFERNIQDRCADLARNNSTRYREVQTADAVEQAYDVYQRAMKPNLVESLDRNGRVNMARQRHGNAKERALGFFDRAIAYFAHEEALVESKRALLLSKIEIRYNDLLNENLLAELQLGGEKLLHDLLHLFNLSLNDHGRFIRNEDEIRETINLCREYILREFNEKKRQFIRHAIQNLLNASPEELDAILVNHYESFSVNFQRAENEFESRVRMLLKTNALNEKVIILEAQGEEQERRYKSLQEEFDYRQAMDEQRKTNGNNEQPVFRFFLEMLQEKRQIIKEERESECRHKENLERINQERIMNENIEKDRIRAQQEQIRERALKEMADRNQQLAFELAEARGQNNRRFPFCNTQ